MNLLDMFADVQYAVCDLGWDGRCAVAPFSGAGEALWAEVRLRLRRVVLEAWGLRFGAWRARFVEVGMRLRLRLR